MRISASLQTDASDILARLNRVAEGAGEGGSVERRMQRGLARAATIMRAAFAANFAAGGRPESWAPLSPRTVAEKMALYHAGIIRGRRVGGTLVDRRRPQPQAPGALFILIRSGRLRNSAVRRGEAGNITRINPAAGTLEVGTNVPYGAYHQQGTRKMPARPFLVLTDEDLHAIMEELSNILLSVEVPATASDS